MLGNKVNTTNREGNIFAISNCDNTKIFKAVETYCILQILSLELLVHLRVYSGSKYIGRISLT